MSADIGPCRARFVKWFFDPDERSCRQFYYGGCHGNGNRFSTQEECESVCFARSEILPQNITISAAGTYKFSRHIAFHVSVSVPSVSSVCLSVPSNWLRKKSVLKFCEAEIVSGGFFG